MDSGDPIASQARAKELARRVVELHGLREAEHGQRTRYSRRPTPFPWKAAAAEILNDEVLDGVTAELLIKELGRAGCADVSLAALELLQARGSPPMLKPHFDAAIAVCCHHFMASGAARVYQAMRTAGIPPSLASANLVIAAHSTGGKVAAAMAVLDELLELGLHPNSFTVAALLQACVFKRQGAWREAVRVVEMVWPCGLGMPPDTARTLLSVCEAAMAKAATFQEAAAVFAELQRLRVAVSTQVCNVMLCCCSRWGLWPQAQHYFRTMEAAGLAPDFRSYTALIEACVRGGALEPALAAYESLVAGRAVCDDIPADIVTYNHLIRSCHQAGLLEKALEIMAWIHRCGIEFDTTTYEELIGTVEVASLWDTKAIKAATSSCLAVFPSQLRPGPFDGMRLMYLAHMNELDEEEALAQEKLGASSWAPRILMAGLHPTRHAGSHITSTYASTSADHASGSSHDVALDAAAAALRAEPLRWSMTPPTPVPLSRAPSMRGLGIHKTPNSALAMRRERSGQVGFADYPGLLDDTEGLGSPRMPVAGTGGGGERHTMSGVRMGSELPSIQQPAGSLLAQRRSGGMGGYMGELPGATPPTGLRPPGLRIDTDTSSPLPGTTHNPGPLTSAQQRLSWGALVPSPLPPLPGGNSNYSITTHDESALSPGPVTSSGAATAKGVLAPGAGPAGGAVRGPGQFSPFHTAAYGPDATTFTVTPLRAPSVPSVAVT
ncbi:MAG: hypothetical protein WDW38_003902 [Sanguina aurantia]